MDIKLDVDAATRAFGALSSQTRLQTFRLLVQRGPQGMAAGDIARAIDVPQNTMSSHLATLVNADLLASRREGRSIIYRVDLAGTQALLTFLLEDCCQGQPEDCISLVNAVLPA